MDVHRLLISWVITATYLQLAVAHLRQDSLFHCPISINTDLAQVIGRDGCDNHASLWTKQRQEGCNTVGGAGRTHMDAIVLPLQ